MSNLLDSKLTTYPEVNEHVMSEIGMQVRERLAFAIMAIAMAASGISVITALATVNVQAVTGLDVGPTWLWLGVAMVLFAVAFTAITVVHQYAHDRHYYYSEVQQGKVLANIARGSGNTAEWLVLVEGFNRMGQTRTYSRPVDADKWHAGAFPVGSYAYFGKHSTD